MGLGMLGALGGLGDAGMQIGNQMMQGAIRSDLMKEQQDYLRQERERVEAVQERKRAEIGKIISGATSGKVDAEGPPTEDGQMPQRQMNEREKMLSSADALGKAGYLDEAVKYQTLAQKDAATEATLGVRRDIQEQTNEIRRLEHDRKKEQGNAKIEIARARLDGKGGAGGGRPDHFDAKQAWEEYKYEATGIRKRMDNIQEAIDKGTRQDADQAKSELAALNNQLFKLNFFYKRQQEGRGRSADEQDIADLKSTIGTENEQRAKAAYDVVFGKGAAAKALGAEKKDAAPTSEEKKPAGGGMLSLPSVGSKAEKTDGPNYDDYIKFKSELDAVKKNASKMSPDAAEQYLAARLPELEKMVKFHSQYRTY